MFYIKIPVKIFELYKESDTIYSLLYMFFNKTTKKGMSEIEDITIPNEEFSKLEKEHYFLIPSPAFTEGLFGTIKRIDLIIYTYLCKEA
ncbi:hypothetical protein [Bacillus nitratireducens]|uniref:hypothetical protein n=1 Tax=Bacillus nitratireducens TaxID=2026193 RepID=UPI0021B27B80|nr:hypothetical protein [Bacillus nitratireducens]